MSNRKIHGVRKGCFLEGDESIKAALELYKKIDKKIVLTQGTFDFIHIGHFLYLEKAKNKGDVLLVGVDSDKKVKERKGPDRPIVSEDERVAMLSHVTHVDNVFIKDEKAKKWHYIKLIKPDVLIATEETYTPAQVKQLREFCGSIVILKPQATTSTSAKIRRLNIGLSNKIQDAINRTIAETFEKITKE